MPSARHPVVATATAVVPKSAFDAAVEYAARLETQVDNAQSLMCKIIALHRSGDMATLGAIIEQLGQRASALAQQHQQQRALESVH